MHCFALTPTPVARVVLSYMRTKHTIHQSNVHINMITLLLSYIVDRLHVYLNKDPAAAKNVKFNRMFTSLSMSVSFMDRRSLLLLLFVVVGKAVVYLSLLL